MTPDTRQGYLDKIAELDVEILRERSTRAVWQCLTLCLCLTLALVVLLFWMSHAYPPKADAMTRAMSYLDEAWGLDWGDSETAFTINVDGSLSAKRRSENGRRYVGMTCAKDCNLRIGD